MSGVKGREVSQRIQHELAKAIAALNEEQLREHLYELAVLYYTIEDSEVHVLDMGNVLDKMRAPFPKDEEWKLLYDDAQDAGHLRYGPALNIFN